MKRLFFTAIAVVAFSSASMANTIADEEVKKDNSEEKEVARNCVARATYMTNCYEVMWGEPCISNEEYDEVWTIYYNQCRGNG